MIKPIKGRPGMFLDEGSGKVLRISDYREGVKYDTVVVPSRFGVPREYVFFRDVYKKSPVDCNFSQPARLNPGEEMLIDRVGLYIRVAVGAYITPQNPLEVGEAAHLRVEINRLLFVEGPAYSFPSGYGYAKTGPYWIVPLGPASQTLVEKMPRTQTLNDRYDIVGYLSFDSRKWCFPVYQGVIEEIDELDDLEVEDPCFVMCILHGLIKAAVNK